MYLKKENGNRVAPSGNKNRIFGNASDGSLPTDLATLNQIQTGDWSTSGAWTYSGTITQSGAISSTNTTESSSKTTGAIVTTGGLGVSKNITGGSQATFAKNIIRANTAYTAATDTTAGWTLAEVKTGLLAGTLKSTTAAAVTMTLDSVANIIASFAAAGVTIGAGTTLEFVLDNTTGANTLTLAVDGGATIAVATPAITGGATLTVSTANKVGRFQLYIYSATAAILSRIV